MKIKIILNTDSLQSANEIIGKLKYDINANLLFTDIYLSRDEVFEKFPSIENNGSLNFLCNACLIDSIMIDDESYFSMKSIERLTHIATGEELRKIAGNIVDAVTKK